MPARGPARLLAPLALVVFVIVLVIVISSGGGGGGGGSKPSPAKDKRPPVARKPPAPPRRYTVQSSDNSLDTIAGKTGVPTERLLQLNPNLDPQSLIPGQRIKLRP
jgi:LysM repeat protein